MIECMRLEKAFLVLKLSRKCNGSIYLLHILLKLVHKNLKTIYCLLICAFFFIKIWKFLFI